MAAPAAPVSSRREVQRSTQHARQYGANDRALRCASTETDLRGQRPERLVAIAGGEADAFQHRSHYLEQPRALGHADQLRACRRFDERPAFAVFANEGMEQQGAWLGAAHFLFQPNKQLGATPNDSAKSD
jgi:hypothetical protein